MATKKQLQQALSFSRRRLMTTLVSGRPGGKELEPAKPMRAVVAGGVLAAMVVGASAVVGMLSPGMPDGWNSNSLIIATDSGARYAAVDTVLYPVLNATSARLLIPASDYKTVSTTESKLAGLQRGPTIGIAGAPDALPAPGRLVKENWVSCVVPTGGTATILDPTRVAATLTETGVLVEVEGTQWLVVGTTRYEIAPALLDGIKRTLGMGRVAPAKADAAWLNLFTMGTMLDALHIEGAGQQPSQPLEINGVSLQVGTVIEASNGVQTTPYVVTAAGDVAELSPLAHQFYLLASPPVVQVPATSIGGRSTAAADVVPADWPLEPPEPWAADADPCALLTPQRNALPTASLALANPPPVDTQPPVYMGQDGRVTSMLYVWPGAGALVRAVPSAPTSSGAVVLIDDTGRAYPISQPDTETLARLGYTADDVTEVPARWLDLFWVGPELTTEAAAQLQVIEVPAAQPAAAEG